MPTAGRPLPESEHVRTVGLAEATDRTVWDYAKTHGLMLVSFDSDFAELTALLGPPPKVIWLRCGNQPTAVIATILRDHVETIAAFEADSRRAWKSIDSVLNPLRHLAHRRQ
jgi:predicted nuclease of predicted toxin-antitoxin system